MKMRNNQVQRGVIVQKMKQRWRCYNHSPSVRALSVEHDCLEVFVSAGCIPQEVCTPLHVTGVRGGTCPPCGGPQGVIPPGWGVWGPAVPRRGFGAAPRKLKTDVKLPCKI